MRRISSMGAVILEEHKVFRESLAYLLSRDPDIAMVAQASTLEEGRAIVLKDAAHVDVVVTEMLWANGDAIRFLGDLGELRESDAEVRVLVLTRLRDSALHDLALEMGAAQVLTKDASVEQIITSIKNLGGS